MSVQSVNNVQTSHRLPAIQNTGEKKTDEKKSVSTTKVLIGLGAAGAIALGILAAKGKFKKKPNNIKDIIGKDPKVDKLTEEEKLKLIKELQAKTDNPDTKETIKKLVENGEWDKLP